MILATAMTLAGVGELTHEFVANPQVDLQASTPGTVQTGHINVSGTVLASTFYGSSGGTTTKVVSGWATSPTGFVFGGDFRTNSVDGRGIFASALSTTGFNYGGDFRSASINGRGIFGYATATTGPNIGGEFRTLSGSGKGVVGSALNASGTGVGVYGEATSQSGYAGYFQGRLNVTGNASFAGPVHAASFAGDGSALTGLNAGNLSSGTVADARLSGNVPLLSAYNTFAGNNQFTGSFTGVGPRTGPIGVGEVFGVSSPSTTWAGMYVSTGVGGLPYYGYNNGSHGAYTYLDQVGSFHMTVDSSTPLNILASGKIGVGEETPISKFHVHDDAANNGSLYAVQGVGQTGTFANTRRALFADSKGSGLSEGILAVGSSSDQGSYGVEAYAFGTGIQNIGVYGDTANGTGTSYAGYFSGLLYASSASSGVKSFLIDHPLDPANKYLEHSSVESDERMDIYRGLAVTDGKGYATISVPQWFEALNEDILYQLTVIDTSDSDAFTLTKVVKNLSDGTFRIRSSTPNAKVSWQLSGRRHDPTSNYYPLQVEREKNSYERNKYLVPEAFGKDRSYSIVRGAHTPDANVQPVPEAKQQPRSARAKR